jgi:hypothetical protein
MSRRSNKAVVEILASSSKNEETSIELDRKITLATEGFTTSKFCFNNLPIFLKGLLEKRSSILR